MKALIATLLLALGACAYQPNTMTYTVTSHDEHVAHMLDTVWTMDQRLEFISNVLYLRFDNIDIHDKAVPEIKVGVYPYFGGWGVAGWYDPENDPNTIWLSQWYVDQYGMDSLEVQAVVIHELTHYVDNMYRDEPGYNQWGKGWQWSEENAWHVCNSFKLYLGYPDEADYTWYTRYGFDNARPVTPWDGRKI